MRTLAMNSVHQATTDASFSTFPNEIMDSRMSASNAQGRRYVRQMENEQSTFIDTII